MGKCLGIGIEKRHYGQLAEYDALLIREKTTISNHTYRFAMKAESEGLVVIDHPTSIMRCTNEVATASMAWTSNRTQPGSVRTSTSRTNSTR